MNDFLKFIIEDKFLSVFIVTISIGVLSSLIFDLLLRKRKVSSSSKEKFFKALDKKFELELISDVSDIIVLRDSINREDDVNYSLAPLLEDYLKFITLTEESDKNKIKTKYAIIKKIVDEETKEKPFVDMPEEERRLLRSLKESIVHKDEQASQFNLDELSTLITTRNRIYSRANRINRWSLPLAILGLITTIIFGLMSITQSIDYDKLAKNVSTQIEKTINTSTKK